MWRVLGGLGGLGFGVWGGKGGGRGGLRGFEISGLGFYSKEAPVALGLRLRNFRFRFHLGFWFRVSMSSAKVCDELGRGITSPKQTPRIGRF